MPSPETDPVSINQETIFSGPFSIEQLGWFGGGLLLLLFLLSIRDFVFARKKWIVPFLFILRSAACAGVFLALAAPVKKTSRTFESGKNVLGIYVDSSASMRLRDPVDGEGNLVRWQIASDQKRERPVLAVVDQSITRIGVALALVLQAVQEDKDPGPTLALLREQLRDSLEEFTTHRAEVPYPDLSDEICESLRTLSGPTMDSLLQEDLLRPSLDEQIEGLQLEIGEILKRGAAMSRELARREESRQKRSDDETIPSRLEWIGKVMKHVESETLVSRADDLKVLRYQFSDNVSTASPEWGIRKEKSPVTSMPSNESPGIPPLTNLNAALQQVADQYRAGQINAAVVMTDAIHNDGDGGALEVPAALKHFPLFVVPAGGNYQLSDITLWRASAPKTVTKGDFLSVNCLVGARGFDGKSTRVRLLENGKELDSVLVTFTEDGKDHNVRLTAPVNTSGAHRFEVEVEPLPGEHNTRNNREFIDLNVYTGDLKVLMVDGWPRWESRYLSNLLKRDESMDHREILFAPEPPNPYPDILSNHKKLALYNIVVLGEVGQEFLGSGEIESLETYVNEGGNLIVLAGQESMPMAFQETKLADILPIQMDRQRPSTSAALQLVPTPAGRRIAALSLEDDRIQNDAVWRLGSTLLPLTEISSFNIPKPGAQVILEAQPIVDPDLEEGKDGPGKVLPYIVWHRYGAGRVFYFSSPTTYHLRYRFGDRYHYRFWGQFLRWSTMAEMLRGQASVQVSTRAKQYSEAESPRVEVELRDAQGEPLTGASVGIRLETSSGGKSIYPCVAVSGKAGIYGVTLPALEHGEYQIEAIGATVEKLLAGMKVEDDKGLLSPQTSFIVEAKSNAEDGDRTCDWETAQRIVDSSAGVLIPPEALQSALEVLARKKVISSREEFSHQPLWNRWTLFILILLFLVIEWAGRKYAGLI